MSSQIEQEPTTVSLRTPEQLVRKAIEAALWAPSVHNTQPWTFEIRHSATGPMIYLYADVERRLDSSDPEGREMLVSCGAALATLRLCLQRHGYNVETHMLPDPDSPTLLAEVRFGDRRSVTEELRSLYGEVRMRRTHRGLFHDAPTAPLLNTLGWQAQYEGADLHVATGETREVLGALTTAAEYLRRMDPAAKAETARWAPAPGTMRQDGVGHMSYPRSSGDSTALFAGRDFARGQGWGMAAEEDLGPAGVMGTVVVLTTRQDTRADWLAAGQALQRILLRASVDHVSAAFHTQALEVPELREFIRTRLYSDAYPQVLLRLGIATRHDPTVRRPAEKITRDRRR